MDEPEADSGYVQYDRALVSPGRFARNQAITTGYVCTVPPEKDRFTVAIEMRIVANCRVFIMSRIVHI
jgi:hypothetical protein